MRAHWLGLTALLCSSTGIARVPAWRLSEAVGSVTVVRAGVSQIAIRDAVVAPGDLVRTGPKARAVLVRGQEYVLVAPGSQVRLPANEQKGMIAQVVQDTGDVIFMIRKMATPHFAVQTPYLAAVVKGTTFSVGVSSTGATVRVLEGAVDVGTVDGGAHEIVRPGSSAAIGADRLTAMRVMTSGVEHVIRSPGDNGAVTVPAPATKAHTGAAPKAGVAAAIVEAPVSLAAVTAGLVTDYAVGITSASPKVAAAAPVALASNIGTASAQTPQGTVAIARESQQEAVVAVRAAMAQQQAAEVAQEKAAEAARQATEQAAAAKAAADQQAVASTAAAAAAQAEADAQQRAADQTAAKAAADAAAQQAQAAQQAAAKQASDQAAAQAAAAQAAAQQQAAAQAQAQAEAAADTAAQQAAAQQAEADAAAKAAAQAGAQAQASGDAAQQAAAQLAAQEAATQQAAAQTAAQQAAQQAKAASDAAAAQSGTQQLAADAAARLQQIADAARVAADAAQQALADAAARAQQAQAAQQAAAQQAATQQAAQAAAQQAAKAADDQKKASNDADKAAKDAQKAADQAAKAAADAQKQAQFNSGKALPDQASNVVKSVLGVASGAITGGKGS